MCLGECLVLCKTPISIVRFISVVQISDPSLKSFSSSSSSSSSSSIFQEGKIYRLRYSKEFREQALKLSDEIGVEKAAEQLGIIYGTLTDRRKTRNRKKEVSTEPGILPLTEREMLKDSLGFFVKDRKK